MTEQTDQLAEILDRLNTLAEAISTLEVLPGSFYVDLTIRMHHHPGDGYANRDFIRTADHLGEWLGLVVRQRGENYGMESTAKLGGTGSTYVHTYLLATPPAPSSVIIDPDI